jgi:hypothetical protein
VRLAQKQALRQAAGTEWPRASARGSRACGSGGPSELKRRHDAVRVVHAGAQALEQARDRQMRASAAGARVRSARCKQEQTQGKQKWLHNVVRQRDGVRGAGGVGVRAQEWDPSGGKRPGASRADPDA